MEQEDQGQRVSRSNGKRSKDKKIPQRGLGVAQLEKIRLEEQRKKVSNSDVSLISPSNSTFMPTTSYVRHEQELNPIWSNSAKHFQQPIASMVNVTTQSSLSRFQIEPPSNQIFYGNSNYFVSSEQEKILGNKRPRFVDNQPSSSFNFGFTAFSKTNPNHTHSNLSESCLPWGSSNPVREPKSKKSINESNATNGNFLAPSSPSSNFNTYDHKIHDFETTPFQGIEKNSNSPTEPRGSTQHTPFYSFFPPAKKHGYESAVTETHCFNQGFNDNLDLNLKL